MSAPKHQSPSNSPTPSKSSLRRTSGVQNTSQRSALPIPSPRFEESTTTEVRYSPRSPPNQTLDYDSNEDEDEDEDEGEQADIEVGKLLQDQHSRGAHEHHEGSYFPTVTAQELVYPFEPLFTLIEDTLTSEHHHPSIHYIFADDDHDIITEAAVRSLGEVDEEESSLATQAKADAADDTLQGQLPPPQPGVREHYLVLDIQPTGEMPAMNAARQSQSRSLPRIQTDESLQQSNPQSQSNLQTPPFVVSSITSLSPDWQLHSATITTAPTMSEAPDSTHEGLMLRIEGCGFPPPGTSQLLPSRGKKGKGRTGGAGEENDGTTTAEPDGESLEEMIERFQNNIREIRKLVGTDLPFDEPPGEKEGVDEELDPQVEGQTYDLDAQD